MHAMHDAYIHNIIDTEYTHGRRWINRNLYILLWRINPIEPSYGLFKKKQISYIIAIVHETTFVQCPGKGWCCLVVRLLCQ